MESAQILENEAEDKKNREEKKKKAPGSFGNFDQPKNFDQPTSIFKKSK